MPVDNPYPPASHVNKRLLPVASEYAPNSEIVPTVELEGAPENWTMSKIAVVPTQSSQSTDPPALELPQVDTDTFPDSR